MENNVLPFIIGVVVGVMLMEVGVWFTMPSLKLIKHGRRRDNTKSLEIPSEQLQQKLYRLVINNNDYEGAPLCMGLLKESAA